MVWLGCLVSRQIDTKDKRIASHTCNGRVISFKCLSSGTHCQERGQGARLLLYLISFKMVDITSITAEAQMLDGTASASNSSCLEAGDLYIGDTHAARLGKGGPDEGW